MSNPFPSTTRGPVLVVGLDGGTMDVIEPLARRGVMPTFAKLIDSGRAGTLHSTVPWYTIPGWTSLMTGVSPGTHGLLHWVVSGDDEYFEGWRPGRRFVTSRDIAHPTFWDIAGAAGRRVVVVNMPLTYPAWPVNGAMITGLLTPHGLTEGGCHPPDLLDRFPSYRVDVSRADAVDLPEERPSSGIEFGPYLRQLVEITRERARVGAELLAEGADLGVVVFVGPDRISHKAWQEQASVAQEPPSTATQGAIEEYYRALDHAVAELLEAIGPGSTVAVVADHGFGPSPAYRLRVNAWLQQAGHLRLRAARAQRAIASSRRIRRLVRGVVRRLKRRRIGIPGRALVDWSRSRAYAVAYSSTSTFGVVVNRVGRKREGIVSEQDAPAIVARIREDLSAMRDDRGRPVVLRIWTREELGGTAPAFPDLIVEVDRRYLPDDGLLSSSVVEPYEDPSGVHEPEGAFILSGPPVRDGEGPIEADIVDVAPTVLGLLGIGAPTGMEGKARAELLDLPEPAPPPSGVTGPGGAAADMTTEEEREIEAHLRSLGYEE